jgi:hypothetical protein
MRIVFTLIAAGILLTSGCGRGSHAVECIEVNGQKVCFVRQLWGRNGDRVYLTTSANVCHQPSAENDFVSDMEDAGAHVYYKIVDGKLFVYGVGEMIKPRNPFPVPVEFDWDIRRGSNPSEAVVKDAGYTRLPLADMTWCFSDLR